MSPSVCSGTFVTVGGAQPAVAVVLVVDGTVVDEVLARVVAVVDVDGTGDSSAVVTEVVVEEDGASPSGDVAATSVFEPSVRSVVMAKTAPTTSATEASPANQRRFASITR